MDEIPNAELMLAMKRPSCWALAFFFGGALWFFFRRFKRKSGADHQRKKKNGSLMLFRSCFGLILASSLEFGHLFR